MKAIYTKKQLRGNDPTGHGYYGAKRGKRKHKGLDIVMKPNDEVTSFIDGYVTKIGYPYKNNLKFRYIEITNDVYVIRIMYMSPKNMSIGDKVYIGDVIGVAQDVAGYWNSRMKNHIHIEIKKHGLQTDPEPLIVKDYVA